MTDSLQVCFVVESERFAWWGPDEPAAAARAHGLPAGPETTLPVAVPAPDGRSVHGVDVPAVLVEPSAALEALAALALSPAASASLRAWAGLADAVRRDADPDPALLAALPTAGHAAVGLDRSSIWSAAAVVDAARRAARPSAGSQYLRPYQRAGVAWMRAAAAHGGGVLADDMGLGKTVQAVALLCERSGRRPHLVVCPTSLIGTWARELARFGPALDVVLHRGPDRGSPSPAPGAVVVTSYALLRGQAGEFAAVGWDVVVLDEAQQVKNPDSQGSRAVRALEADLRIAMTGTPVENRLDDLWSLVAFTTPGLLGSRARFRRRFAVAIEQRRSAQAAARLHEIVGPHILRRRKLDVAPELPERIVVPVVCAMSDEQEQLYRRAVDDGFTAGLGDGIARRGRVLALLTRLTLIANHPELDTPTGAALAGRSGKLDRTVEILGEVVDGGERALVFTRYRCTGELLAEHLRAEVTRTEVPFLHGGLSGERRDDLVRRFSDEPDGPPILVLSLRAAGVGLTLTRATHVLHYDRWWNPAVEDQASDRAHRIGQTQPVTIHALSTERTLEEALASMHEEKRRVASVAVDGPSSTDSPVAGADGDLARLSDERLRALLDGDAAQRSSTIDGDAALDAVRR